MAYRYGERQQHMLFPQRIEDYISEDDPVRVYDAFVDALPWNSLGIESNQVKAGCPQYDPKTMLKILIYAYSYGIRSSRKIERALYHNVSFIWLAGGLEPDYRTIARFRKNNVEPLKKVLRQCARLCLKLKVIAGNTLFVDGSKFRANAGINNTRTKKGCKELLEKVDQRIDQLLRECEQTDQAEKSQDSFVKLQEELSQKQTLKAKVQDVLDTLNSEGLDRINTTDPDCIRIHGRQGSHAGYNAQITVDEEHGLIVNSDVVTENNDQNQFANQIEQAHDILESPCKNACADAGYSDGDELEKIDQQDITVIVPNQQQASKKDFGPFHRSQFHYNSEEDCYICPAGKHLTKLSYNGQYKAYSYAAGSEVCAACCHFGICTTGKTNGRTVIRYLNQAVRDKLADQYEQASSKAIFSRRKETVELPFGHLKHNLGAGSFLLRGLEGVRAEMSVLCSCFNIARLIGIYGISGLLTKLAE